MAVTFSITSQDTASGTSLLDHARWICPASATRALQTRVAEAACRGSDKGCPLATTASAESARRVQEPICDPNNSSALPERRRADVAAPTDLPRLRPGEFCQVTGITGTCILAPGPAPGPHRRSVQLLDHAVAALVPTGRASVRPRDSGPVLHGSCISSPPVFVPQVLEHDRQRRHRPVRSRQALDAMEVLDQRRCRRNGKIRDKPILRTLVV